VYHPALSRKAFGGKMRQDQEKEKDAAQFFVERSARADEID